MLNALMIVTIPSTPQRFFMTFSTQATVTSGLESVSELFVNIICLVLKLEHSLIFPPNLRMGYLSEDWAHFCELWCVLSLLAAPSMWCEFSNKVTQWGGNDRSPWWSEPRAAGPPGESCPMAMRGLSLRANNGIIWEHCGDSLSAVIEYSVMIRILRVDGGLINSSLSVVTDHCG